MKFSFSKIKKLDPKYDHYYYYFFHNDYNYNAWYEELDDKTFKKIRWYTTKRW